MRFVVWLWHLLGEVSRESRFGHARTQRANVDFTLAIALLEWVVVSPRWPWMGAGWG